MLYPVLRDDWRLTTTRVGLSAQPHVAEFFPRRWQAFARIPGEIVLSRNRETFEDLERELEALSKVAEIPAEPAFRGGYWTIRSGFEAKPAAWHWKPGAE